MTHHADIEIKYFLLIVQNVLLESLHQVKSDVSLEDAVLHERCGCLNVLLDLVQFLSETSLTVLRLPVSFVSFDIYCSSNSFYFVILLISSVTFNEAVRATSYFFRMSNTTFSISVTGSNYCS